MKLFKTKKISFLNINKKYFKGKNLFSKRFYERAVSNELISSEDELEIEKYAKKMKERRDIPYDLLVIGR